MYHHEPSTIAATAPPPPLSLHSLSLHSPFTTPTKPSATSSTTTTKRTASSPRSPPSLPSPLIRRIPAMLSAHEEFVSDDEDTRRARESTPRSKRLRRTSDQFASQFNTPAPGGRSTRESTAAVFQQLADDDDEIQELSDLIQTHGFTPQEASLFLRIRNRGFEPLMPAHWQVDFGTMPDSLFFPHQDGENVVGHIDSITLAGTFQATTAFQNLINLGVIVRGKLEAKKDPEDRVLAAMKKYIQWSVDDVRANLKSLDIVPRIVLVGSMGRGALHCETRMSRKLSDLALEVREEEDYLASCSHPRSESASSTVYGLAVAGCVVALVSLDARQAQPKPKTLALLDFSDTTLDFWNAVAVALMVIAAREDDLERNEWYDEQEVKRPLVENSRRRGWEGRNRRLTEHLDEDL